MANIFTLENFSDFSEKINIDELYEKRAEVSLKRIHDELSSAELRVLEGEFDAYFRRTVSKIENYINQE